MLRVDSRQHVNAEDERKKSTLQSLTVSVSVHCNVHAECQLGFCFLYPLCIFLFQKKMTQKLSVDFLQNLEMCEFKLQV